MVAVLRYYTHRFQKTCGLILLVACSPDSSMTKIGKLQVAVTNFNAVSNNYDYLSDITTTIWLS
ncbi:unnamed protein product [Acanthoscelides obtectus]|uniref:Uncharacterized protein n=1 Tax=Acanthoscelides obtectus TaxID=200917 RepID=A0A9P0KCG5_ACAOB|nr:unnamed protein product [Acanthoscelides obtectus]CAK1662351.1 hypothetical protein AOBTE_LOCUS23101 [Acanthoscelides obtectus]